MYRLLLTALVAGCLVVGGCGGEAKKPKKPASKTPVAAPAEGEKAPAPETPAKPAEKKPAEPK